MMLTIRTNPSCDVSVQSKESDTILCLKHVISKELKTPIDKFYLCYDQETLEDANTLGDYGLQSGAVIYCVIKPDLENRLKVKLDDSTLLDIGFQFTDSIQKIKRIIGEKAYGRRCPLVVFYNGVQLEDLKMLKDYGIVSKSEIIAFRYLA